MIFIIVTFCISLHLDVVKTDENVTIPNWCPYLAPFNASHLKVNYIECKDGESDRWLVFYEHDICTVLNEESTFLTWLKLEFDPSIRLKELMDDNICSFGEKTNVFDFINTEDPLKSCSFKFRIKGAEMTMGHM